MLRPILPAKFHLQIKAACLGDEFRAEIKSALPRIQAWPLSCPVERGDIRRLTLSRFPYKLLYSVESDHIYVIDDRPPAPQARVLD